MKKEINKNFKNRGVVIYGFGNAGKQVCNLILNNNKNGVLCFIDDDKKKIGKKYKNIKIHPKEMLTKFKRYNYITSIIIAIPSLNNLKLSKLFNYLFSFSSSVLNLPLKSEYNSHKINLSDLQKSELVAIFNERKIKPNKNKIQNLYNKKILVTGAGGSIGSELVHQLTRNTKHKILCLDKSELALYNLKNNLNHDQNKIKLILGDIADSFLIKNLIKAEKINCVFHTAAYKHLNFLETNPDQAIKNNIIGTYKLLKNINDSSKKNIKIINISTDKAVKPISILGISKRITEIICKNYENLKNSKINISTVRFGNVFGSDGSVINLFLDKINKGEDVFITSKNVERYFMSINQACNLVISASIFKDEFCTYILDMGKPVKIYDLLKNIIKLKTNYKKNLKIRIIETKLNRGEKISEELAINKNLKKTNIEKIMLANEPTYKKKDVDILINKIINKVDTKKNYTIINDLKKFLRKETNF